MNPIKLFSTLITLFKSATFNYFNKDSMVVYSYIKKMNFVIIYWEDMTYKQSCLIYYDILYILKPC